MKVIRKNVRFVMPSEVFQLINVAKEENVTPSNGVVERCMDRARLEGVVDALIKRGLFPIEAYQIVWNHPKDLLTMQLLVEEMEERYSIEELQEMLEIINNSS